MRHEDHAPTQEQRHETATGPGVWQRRFELLITAVLVAAAIYYARG